MRYSQNVVPYSESDFYDILGKRERLLTRKRIGQKTLLESIQDLELQDNYYDSSDSYSDKTDNKQLGQKQEIDTPDKKYLERWKQKTNNSQADQDLFELIQCRQRNLKVDRINKQEKLQYNRNKRRKKDDNNNSTLNELQQKTKQVFEQIQKSSRGKIRPTKKFMERWYRSGCCQRCTSPIRESSPSPQQKQHIQQQKQQQQQFQNNFNGTSSYQSSPRQQQQQYNNTSSPQHYQIPIYSPNFQDQQQQINSCDQNSRQQSAQVQQILGENIEQIRDNPQQALKPHQYAQSVDGGLVRSGVEQFFEQPLDYLICSVCNKPCCQGCNCQGNNNNNNYGRNKVRLKGSRSEGGSYGDGCSQLQNALSSLRGTSNSLQQTLIDLNVDLKSHQLFMGQK
eukprot:TRINITY_DN6710_c0_g1_i12.p1 TRINITY_DN6710_c0_g1~~TRINITY_DN6710_c0_g1_i12.p1  ORF type:complete len:395 (-),score=25.41 TRINITY_DN6710_c0_g1_i12:689-1873(-)